MDEKLFNNNLSVEFDCRISLLEYKEREYINKLTYHGEAMLIKGDLPNNGVLKHLITTSIDLSLIENENVIPKGIETIKHYFYNQNKSIPTPFKKLPSTLNSINNVIITTDLNNPNNQIPLNITSISFLQCPNISSPNSFKIPFNIKSLKFNYYWNNEDVLLKIGDLPNNGKLTSLDLAKYNILNLTNDIIPSSVKDLYITYNNNNNNNLNFKNILPNNIEKLSFNFKNNNNNSPPPIFSNLQNLNLFQSITNLTIYLNGNLKFEEYSLPTSINTLSIIGIPIPLTKKSNDIFKLKKNVINENVKSLILFFQNVKITNIELLGNDDDDDDESSIYIPSTIESLKINKLIFNEDVFPKSLTSLNIDYNSSFTFHHLIKMLSIIPSTIKTIQLPKSYQPYNFSSSLSLELFNKLIFN